MQSVIPGLTRNPGLPAFGGARGDQGFFWIPAGVYPRPKGGGRMTISARINVTRYNTRIFPRGMVGEMGLGVKAVVGAEI